MKVIVLNSGEIETVVASDSLPPIKIQIVEEDGTPVDITGKKVYLKLNVKNVNGTIGTSILNKEMTIVSALSGLANYNWAHSQLDVDLDLEPGTYIFDVVLIEADVASAIATPVVVISTGNETAAKSGTFTGDQNSVYTVEVTTGGTYGGVGQVTITSIGAETVSTTHFPATGVPFNLGTKGVIFTLTDGGGGLLTVGDKWTVTATASIPGAKQTLTKTSYSMKIRQKLV